MCEYIRQHFSHNPGFIIRTKNGKSGMKAVAALPMEELDVEVETVITANQAEALKNGRVFIQTHTGKNRLYSTKTRNGRWDFPSPYPMKLRVVRLLLPSGQYETLLTSLPNTFTPDDLRELYHARWGIESAFRELEYSIGVANIHSRLDGLPEQEIYAGMIAATLCSRIVNRVVIEKKDNRKYAYRVNQKMAIHLIKDWLRDPEPDSAKLMADIARYLRPVRPDRQDARKLRVRPFPPFVYRVAA